MGWAVGWDQGHQRHRGYGVPAYCDAKGCTAEIDRGLGYVAVPPLTDDEYDEWDDLADGTLFVCVEHEHADIDEAHLPVEHPDWVAHVLGDETWEQWRSEHPEMVDALATAQRYVVREWVTDEVWLLEAPLAPAFRAIEGALRDAAIVLSRLNWESITHAWHRMVARIPALAQNERELATARRCVTCWPFLGTSYPDRLCIDGREYRRRSRRRRR